MLISASLQLFFVSISLPFLVGLIIPFLPFDKRKLAGVSFSAAFVGSLIGITWAIIFWTEPSNQSTILFAQNLPGIGNSLLSLELRADKLTSFFLFLVAGFSSAVSIYSFYYLGLINDTTEKLEMDAHGIAAAYNLFVGAMLLVLVANNVFSMLVTLEVMSLSFAYLVLFRHNKNRDSRGAAWTKGDKRARKLAIQSYLISSHVSLVFLTVALVLRAVQVGSFSFEAFQRSGLPAGWLVFGLAFVGLAIRAGVVPFHIWIPLAHPSSPTNTHALSLGVAIKVAIFLMIRIFFELLGPIDSWWGPVVLVLAGLTAVVGVYYAIVSRDLKTALSYHSIENVGIILVGIGLALTLASNSEQTMPGVLGLAGLALIAGLYHTLNHALFKGLLYLCTGVIEKITGTVEYHDLGGLMRVLPWTSTAFLVGAISIAGFPPFNGFISEWLTLQALFFSLNTFVALDLPFAMGAVILVIVFLASAFGLTAFAFVKITGEAILGAPRHQLTRGEKREPWFVRVIFVLLGGLCLLLGIVVSPIVSALGQVTQSIGLPATTLSSGPLGLSIANVMVEQPSYSAFLSSPLLWLFAIGLLVLVIWTTLSRRRYRIDHQSIEEVRVWTSGIHYDSRRMQATEAFFGYQVYEPLSRPISSTAHQEGLNQEKGDPYLIARRKITDGPLDEGLPISADTEVLEVFRLIYDIFLGLLIFVSELFSGWVQNGNVRLYVAYVFMALVILVSLLIIIGVR